MNILELFIGGKQVYIYTHTSIYAESIYLHTICIHVYVPEVCGLFLQYDPLGLPHPDHVQVSDGADMPTPTRTLALQAGRQLQLHTKCRREGGRRRDVSVGV